LGSINARDGSQRPNATSNQFKSPSTHCERAAYVSMSCVSTSGTSRRPKCPSPESCPSSWGPRRGAKAPLLSPVRRTGRKISPRVALDLRVCPQKKNRKKKKSRLHLRSLSCERLYEHRGLIQSHLRCRHCA